MCGAFSYKRSILLPMNAHFAKHLGLALAALVLLALTVWYLSMNSKAPDGPTGMATSTPSADPSRPVTITDHSTYYEVDAQYPEGISFPLSSRSDAGVSAETQMKNWIGERIEEFKRNGNFANLTHDDIQILGLDQNRYTLDIRYESYEGKRTRTYVYTEHQYTGGAHGNTFYRTFTFDMTTGTEVKLSDLFTPGTAHLTELSRIARAELPKQIGEFADDAFIRTGTEPTEESFASFYIDGTKLVLLFPPYAVGPYALGTVSLPIPLDSLSSIKPEYR